MTRVPLDPVRAVSLAIVLAGCGTTSAGAVAAAPAEPGPSESAAVVSGAEADRGGDAVSRGAEALAACRQQPVALEVLGSGGPIVDPKRASTGYLVWARGHARVWIDIGPGTMLRYAESGAEIGDLQVLLLTHGHVDHSADLAAFAKVSSFGDREAPLPVIGPAGRKGWPSTTALVSGMLGEQGTYRYLSGFLADGRPFRLEPRDVRLDRPATVVLEDDDVTVRAVGVPHGPVPALGYEVTVDGTRIGFTGDQRADDPRFAEMVQGVDLLVAHLAVGPKPDEVAAKLHATPQALGRLAATTSPGTLVLSHLMQRALEGIDDNVAAIEREYDGPVIVAEDHLCVPVREAS